MSYFKDNENKEALDNEALDWDSEIEEESNFILLPAGTYDYTVTNLERNYFEGSDKMSACPMATLTIQAKNRETGEAGEIGFINLFLHKKTEWKLSEFFISIGQKQHGEKLKPNWGKVIGAKGQCEIEVNTFIGRDGKEKQSNQVKHWLPPVEEPEKKWKAGSF